MWSFCREDDLVKSYFTKLNDEYGSLGFHILDAYLPIKLRVSL